MITYANVSYYYLLNAQGDVVGIMNVSGDIMVEYTYDAWGNVLSITGPMADTMGQHNQLRYRGYVYDPETELYFLNSRFYNPETGRFLNADSFAATGQGILGNNMFAYCQNNPARYIDPQGTFICTIIGALVGGVIGAINAAIEGDDVWAGMVIGAGTGALAGAAADVAIATGGVGAVVIAAAGGAVASGTNYVATEIVNDRPINGGKLAVEMTIGAVANVLTFGVGGGSLEKAGGKLISNIVNNFTNTVMKNATKQVAGKTVLKTAKTVIKHVTKNVLSEIADTTIISGGAWVNSKVWGAMVP